MSVFCTDNSNLVQSLNTLLTKCNQNNYLDSFNQSPDNELLSRACGIPAPTNIFENNNFNTNLPAVPDQTTFYNFWNVLGQVEDLSDRFRNILMGGKSFPGDASKFYPLFNALIGRLFYFLVCTVAPSTNSPPLLKASDPNATILDNWKYFLANLRGISSKNTCQYCLDNYLLPAIGSKGASSAGKLARNLLANNPFLRGWCGCCIPQSGDYNYKGDSYNFLNPFIGKTNTGEYSLNCEPVCNTPGETFDASDKSIIIPLIEGDSQYVNAVIPVPTTNLNYEPPTCNDTVCVINNITIETIATKGGGINFNQVCPGCVKDPGKCICYTYGKGAADKISSGNSGMQDPAIFKQNCPNAFCFEEQVNGNYKEVKCNTVNPGNTGKDPINTYNGTGVFNDLSEANIYGVDTWLFPISLLVILIILFLGAIFVTVYRNRVIPRMRQENQ